MEPTNPNPVFNPGTNKKNIRLWFLVVFAALVVVFFSISYVKKFTETNKVARQNQQAEQKCFQSDEENYRFAIEKKSSEYCDCIKNSEKKNSCLKPAEDSELYNQAVKSSDINICKNIVNLAIKEACEKVIESGISNLEKEKNQKLSEVYSLDLFNNGDEIDSYEKVIKENSTNIENYLKLALAYNAKSLKLKEYEQEQSGGEYFKKAIKAIDDAGLLDKNNAQIYRVRAYIYLTNYKYPEAQKETEKAIELLPEKPYLYQLLADALYQQKEYDLALEKTKIGLDLLKNNVSAIEADKKIGERKFYSLLVGIYHQMGDVMKEEEYKGLINKII